MIVFLRKKGDSLGPYLRNWAPELAPRIRAFNYDEWREWREPPPGTYVFADTEIFDERQRAAAIELRRRLESADSPTRVLNDPSLVPSRYELLRMLHELGINTHRAYRLSEAHRARFPVFLRRERRHSGSLTRVLRSRRELMRALVWAYRRGVPMHDLLVVEYCDTADADGNYHKYGAFFVDGRVLPRGLVFRREWMVKASRRPVPERQHLEMHREYVETNPHESWIRMVFSNARIDYGRVDYSLQNGRPRVWEINTNPTPFEEAAVLPVLQPQARLFAEAFQDALEAMDLASAKE